MSKIMYVIHAVWYWYDSFLPLSKDVVFVIDICYLSLNLLIGLFFLIWPGNPIMRAKYEDYPLDPKKGSLMHGAESVVAVLCFLPGVFGSLWDQLWLECLSMGLLVIAVILFHKLDKEGYLA